MTLDTPSADAAPTRRSRRDAAPSAPVEPSSQPSAPAEPAVPLTRAERRRHAAAQAVDAPAEGAPAPVPSLAETVVAEVAAAIVAESVVAESVVAAESVAETAVAEADLPSRRRLRHAAPEVDEFAYAARLFAFSEAVAPARVADEPAPRAVVPVHVAPRRAPGAAFRKVAAGSLSLGAMAIVGLLAVGTTTPAEALGPASLTTSDEAATASSPAASDEAIQAFVSTGGTDAGTLNRSESYGVASMADIAAAGGVKLFSGAWVSDPSAKIQWPFPVGVPISAAYGSSSYLAEFSLPHHGVDLTPGEGAEIQVIAAGTVRIATEAGGDYGVTVVVDHVIDGQLVSTRYAHMQRDSLTVEVGDTVTAGEVIGRVGQTGKATGPHLHFEVLLNGTTPTDPIAWMYAHTTGTHTVG